uniref:Envelope membrane protein n=1 Tax=Chlamydomonas leiostraca TaxID=1034604 RepID=A0A1L2M561_9CHLO|nr:envelope membrane protein [Chlamydomonas leiostraca]APD80595.1 envelope membrane protein [Chlamydomonas leiostraca]
MSQQNKNNVESNRSAENSAREDRVGGSPPTNGEPRFADGPGPSGSQSSGINRSSPGGPKSAWDNQRRNSGDGDVNPSLSKNANFTQNFRRNPSAPLGGTKQEVVSITYEEIGLFPRSFSRVLDRFLKQVFSDVENLVIQEYRFYRYLFLTTFKSLLILFFVPFFVNFLAKNYVVRPLTEYFWNTKQTEIFLNSYQQKRAFAELKDFEEKLYFESLIYPKSPERVSAPQATPPTSDGRERLTDAEGVLTQRAIALGNSSEASLAGGPSAQMNTSESANTSGSIGSVGGLGNNTDHPVGYSLSQPSMLAPGYHSVVARKAAAPLENQQLGSKSSEAASDSNSLIFASGKVDSVLAPSSQLAPPLASPIGAQDEKTESLINSYTLKSSLFVYQTREADKNIQQRYQEKTIELAQRYNDQSIEAITNFFADLISLLTLFYLLYALEIQINITKSFLLEVFFGLDDSKKSLLILLVTDLLVGYHSSNLWELFFEFLFNHYGLPESQTGIFLLVATLPVLLDVLFKYLIFRHLNRSSPATVATYHAMIE